MGCVGVRVERKICVTREVQLKTLRGGRDCASIILAVKCPLNF